MRLACTIAKDDKGKWHTLALPQDGSPLQQREALKKLTAKGGKANKVQYVEAIVLSTSGSIRRGKFRDNKSTHEAIREEQRKWREEEARKKDKAQSKK